MNLALLADKLFPSPTVSPLQYLSLVMVVFTIIYGILASRRFPSYRWIIGGFLTLPVHLLLFYSILIYADVKNLSFTFPLFTGWSAGLRLHEIIVSLAGVLVMYYRGKLWTPRQPLHQ